MAKMEFKTEVNDLLNLMIHSLYSNKEIFLRELISNASDALDKLHFLALTDEKYKNLNFTPKIEIFVDKDKKILKICDNGIGMNENELKENLGTIARSGTKGFLSKLSGDKAKDSNLIGQFGVGFYSAFMVANNIEVISKKPLEESAFIWISDTNGYEIKETQKDDFGTEIILHLNDDEFLNEYKIENIIKKYSNHIPYAIFMEKDEYIPPKDDEKEGKTERKISKINTASALWQMPKNELKDSDYNEFYKQISHDSTDPLLHIHTKAEGAIEYSTLFYVPSNEPFDLFRVDYQSGVKLYVKRVFISDDAKELMPTYLRFIRGIIDVEDLPLNVSREILQENRIMANVKEQSVKKILSEFKKMLENDREKYEKFFNLFGKVLKEGLYGFNSNKEEIASLCLFKSNKTDKLITLKEYKSNMKDEQKEIYYICGNNAKMLKNSPLLESFESKDYEVLLCDDEIDGVVMPMLMEFDKTPIKSVNEADILGDFDDAKFSEITNKIKEILSDQVKDVKATNRLNKTASCLAYDKNDPDFTMQKIMQQMGQEVGEIKPILQINPNHEILAKFLGSGLEKEISQLLLDMAKLSNSEAIKDPNAFNDALSSIILKAIKN